MVSGSITSLVTSMGTDEGTWSVSRRITSSASDTTLPSTITGASGSPADDNVTGSSLPKSPETSKDYNPQTPRRFALATAMATLAFALITGPSTGSNIEHIPSRISERVHVRTSWGGLADTTTWPKRTPVLSSDTTSGLREAVNGDILNDAEEFIASLNNPDLWDVFHDGITYARQVAMSASYKETSPLFNVQYPSALIEEYKALKDKKYSQGLTVRDKKRFAEIKARFNSIDRLDPAKIASVQRAKEVRKGLTSLRQRLDDELAASSDQG